MKPTLIISFDYIQDGEPGVSYAIGCLLANLKSHPRYGSEFDIIHIPLNLSINPNLTIEEVLTKITKSCSLNKISNIAIGCYVWSDHITNPLIDALKQTGFRGKIILGGNQIQLNSCETVYPKADKYIIGHGEESLLKAITDPHDNNIIYEGRHSISQLPSPYLSSEIQIPQNQSKVRLETKRGCPYRCSFCAHKDLDNKKIINRDMKVIEQEILLFKRKNVGKINVIDPVFNTGSYYLTILNLFIKHRVKAQITLQTRFELLFKKEGSKFIDLCKRLNVHLEFGLQTIHPEEYKVINRHNNINQVKKAMKLLNESGISFETSLIFGLPNQTLESFKSSVSFVMDNHGENITAFPLMLLNGTELSKQKKTLGLKEKIIGNGRMPYVVANKSFTNEDWIQMQKIAGKLETNASRIIINQYAS